MGANCNVGEYVPIVGVYLRLQPGTRHVLYTPIVGVKIPDVSGIHGLSHQHLVARNYICISEPCWNSTTFLLLWRVEEKTQHMTWKSIYHKIKFDVVKVDGWLELGSLLVKRKLKCNQWSPMYKRPWWARSMEIERLRT